MGGPLGNVDRIQVATATRPDRKLNTRKGIAGRALLRTDHGPKQGYLKLLDVQGIAKESLCWALSRCLGLPIPQAYYVYANPNDLSELSPRNKFCLAFGTEEMEFSRDRIENRKVIESKLFEWEFSLQCGVFDEWIVNGDRIPNNLLYSSHGKFTLIDHDEVLPTHASVDSHSISEVLKRLSQNSTESAKHNLFERTKLFVLRIQRIDWERIRQMIIVENVPEVQWDMFMGHKNFLMQRAKILPEVLHLSLGISQTELLIGDDTQQGWEKIQ